MPILHGGMTRSWFATVPAAGRSRLGDVTSVSTALFAAVVLAGLALRLLALRTSLAQQDSDNAIVFLMARHVVHGDWRVFYWGQFYGGTLLQFTAAVPFWLNGPSFAALQVVEIAYWLAACLLLRSVVAKGSRVVAGNLAGAAFWLAMPLMVRMSFSDGGFYGDGLVIALLTIRLAQGGEAPAGRLRCFAVGLCVGLALWTNPLALAFALPAAGWFFLRVRAASAALSGLAGAVVGATPWLYGTIKSRLQTLHRPHQMHVDPLSVYIHVFTRVVPGAADLRPDSVQGRVAATAAFAILLGGACAAVWRRNSTIFVLALAGLLVPAVVAASGEQIVPSGRRYATFLVPSIAAIVGWAFKRLWLAGAVTILLAATWTTATVWDASNGLASVRHPAVGEPIATLARRLEHMHRTDVWADYWISYLLSAASQERILAADLSLRREESYLNSARNAARTTVVVFPDGENQQTLRALPHLPPHKAVPVGPYVVWAFSTHVDVDRHLFSTD